MKLFRNVGIISKKRHPELSATLQNIIDFLRQQNVSILLEEDTANLLATAQFPAYSKQELGQHCDLFIVVGGDGSLLHTAQCAAETDTPVVGINRGRLGFLTDIHPDELTQKLQAVFNGKFQEEKRFLLNAELNQHTYCNIPKGFEGVGRRQASRRRSVDIIHEDGEGYSALNEILVVAGPTANMVEFATYVDDQFVCSQRADGIIISTPTGSTAYALSASGPILHPGLNAIALVPMLPHTLSSRPLVVTGDSRITITIAPENPASALLSCDGKERINIEPGQSVTITKKTEQLRLIHPMDYNYFDTLRSKLHWEKQHI